MPTPAARDTDPAIYRTWVAGRHPGQVPIRIESVPARFVVPIVIFVFKHVLTCVRTPVAPTLQRMPTAQSWQSSAGALCDSCCSRPVLPVSGAGIGGFAVLIRVLESWPATIVR